LNLHIEEEEWMRQAAMSQDLLQMNNNDETPTDDSGDNKKMKMLFNEVWLRPLDDAFCDLQLKIVLQKIYQIY